MTEVHLHLSFPSGTELLSEEDPTIFLVDDDPASRQALALALSQRGYLVTEFARPLETLRAVKEQSPALLLSDLNMPGTSGVDLARICMEVDPDTAVILFTGHATVRSVQDCLRLGVVDYLEKPIQTPALLRAVVTALRRRSDRILQRETQAWLRRELERREEALEAKEQELRSRSVGILTTLMGLMEARNPYFKGHSEAVARVAVAVARESRLPPDLVEEIRVGGLLHDIGMIAVPENIMNKSGDLTTREIAYVQEHCRHGEKILRPLQHLRMTLDCVLHHHERLDGSGYPDGLMGDAISVPAQIVGLAEAFVAMGEDRPFRGGLDVSAALTVLRNVRDVWFRGHLIDALTASAARGFRA